MKAFLIDPWAKEITEVQIPRHKEHVDLAILMHLTPPFFEWVVEIYEISWRNGTHALLDDEHALRHQKEDLPAFVWETTPVWGRALIVGISEGDFVDATYTLNQVTKNVSFL